MKIAIAFINIGTYHFARLHAAALSCRRAGWQMTAIQATDDVLDHPWGHSDPNAPFESVTLLRASERGARAAQEAFSSRAGERMRECLSELRPDVLFVPGWSHPIARAGLHWCLKARAHSVIMSESTVHDFARVWWREAYKGVVVRASGAALVGGRPHREYLTRLGMRPESIFLGYDVVDNEYFESRSRAARSQASALRRELALPEKYFLASSRFVQKKNLHRLLEGFDVYRRRASASPWHLVVLGDGPLRPQLEELIRDRDLSEFVHLPGFATYEQVPKYLGLASAFVHVSTTEQWGLVVNEAMAAGLPVIVSDRCGCAPDLVTANENGFLVDPHRVDEIADRLGRMANLPEIVRAEMASRSRAIIDHWSPALFGQSAVDAATCASSHRRAGLRERLERAFLTSTATLFGALTPTMRGA